MCQKNLHLLNIYMCSLEPRQDLVTSFNQWTVSRNAVSLLGFSSETSPLNPWPQHFLSFVAIMEVTC